MERLNNMSDNKLNGVYKIVCKTNNKMYIGESHDIAERWNGHIADLRAGKHHSYKLQEDFDRHGIYNFSFEILDLLKEDSKGYYELTMIRIYREGCYIQYFKSIENGYNIENTLTEILNGNKHRLSPNDKHCLNSLKNGHEIIVPDDLVNEIIEIKPVPKVEKEKKPKKSKKEKKTSVKKDNNTVKIENIQDANSFPIINNTGVDIPIESMCGVYSITNIINGKVLIAYSKRILSRINSNIKKLEAGTFNPTNFQAEWTEFGKDNFVYELLEQFHSDEDQEIYFHKMKYMCNSTNSYHDISNKARFEYGLLKQLYDNDFKYKKNYIQRLSDTERLLFDIAVMNTNGELQGLIIIDNSIDLTMTPEMLIEHQSSNEIKVKYCEDNNIGYKVMKVKAE